MIDTDSYRSGDKNFDISNQPFDSGEYNHDDPGRCEFEEEKGDSFFPK